MAVEGTKPAETERYLSPAQVAARFLTRIEVVTQWIAEGRLQAEPGGRVSYRIPESAVLAFEKQAHRRENYNGADHGLHSWPNEQPESSALPIPVETAAAGEATAPRWPFSHA
jgi:hypothetical protein